MIFLVIVRCFHIKTMKMPKAEFFAGSHLAPMPHESAFSIVSRYLFNNLQSASTFRVKFKREPKSWKGTAELYVSQEFWDKTGWSPSPLERVMYSWANEYSSSCLHAPLRFCPICMEYLYHSFWFQWRGICICPLHLAPLMDCCQSCGAEFDSGLPNVLSGDETFKCRVCGGFWSGIPVGLQTMCFQSEWQAHSKHVDAAFQRFAEQFQYSVAHAKSLNEAFSYGITKTCEVWMSEESDARQLIFSVTGVADGQGLLPSTVFCFLSWSTNLLRVDPRNDDESCGCNQYSVFAATMRLLENWLFGRRLSDKELTQKIETLLTLNDRSGEFDDNQAAYLLFRHHFERRFMLGDNAFRRGGPVLSYRYLAGHSVRDVVCKKRLEVRAWLLLMYARTRHSLGNYWLRERRERQFADLNRPVSVWHNPPAGIYDRRGLTTMMDRRTAIVYFPSVPGLPLQPFRFTESFLGRAGAEAEA